VMRVAICCRLGLLSISSWVPISAVVRGVARTQLVLGFTEAVNRASPQGRGITNATRY
jgi:hypothetical protein